MYAANPYAVPTTSLQQQPVVIASGEMPSSIPESLRATRPWALVLSILGFMGAGLMFLMGLAMMAFDDGKDIPRWAGGIYLVLGVLYVPPSIFLVRYALSITRFLEMPTLDKLGDALKVQKSFWQVVGIMTIGTIVLTIVGSVAVGIIMAMKAATH